MLVSILNAVLCNSSCCFVSGRSCFAITSLENDDYICIWWKAFFFPASKHIRDLVSIAFHKAFISLFEIKSYLFIHS